MTAIRSSCFERLGCFGRPLELWCGSPGRSRKLTETSPLERSIIFLALCPLVLLSGISEFICWSLKTSVAQVDVLCYGRKRHTDRENLDFDPILARMCPLDEGAKGKEAYQ
eukprot:Skav204595  [mRNA]  locus=scaffold672:197749:198795:- [translate_table: standard]